MTTTPTIERRPVATLSTCAICGGPVPIASGRDLCLGCVRGDVRPVRTRPTPGGDAVTLRRRVVRRRLSPLAWAWIDALGVQTLNRKQLAAALGIATSEVRQHASRACVIRSGLVLELDDGYRLSAVGLDCRLTREPPTIVRLERDSLESKIRRTAAWRARVRAKGGES